MAQRKILLDTCAYLRLARSVHPLLGVEFGDEPVCLYLIKEMQSEYDANSRLTTKFPWVDDPEYVANRRKSIRLSRKQQKELAHVIDAFDDYAFDQGLTPSPVDLRGLATAYLAGIKFVTDDRDVIATAAEFGVPVLRSLGLLRLMVDEDHISMADARAACDYIEYVPDLPADYYADRKRLFGY